jgi:hypothetical protein
LDLGCGPSFIAKQCQKLGVEVASIDLFDSFRGAVDQFCQLDLESNPTLRDAFRFDIILLLDTIERFANPERLLLNLRNRGDALSADLPLPILVLSTPNIAFAAIRLNLLFGRFNYAERGILDITHKRLFTRRSLLHMLHECGYTVEKIYPAAVPFQAVMKGYAGKILQWLATRLANFWPNLFAFQFVVACRPKPGVAQLIRWSEKHHMASRVMSNYLNIFDENKDV